jgi:hypothetical protein
LKQICQHASKSFKFSSINNLHRKRARKIPPRIFAT